MNADERLLPVGSKSVASNGVQGALGGFLSPPGVQRGLPGLLICSFYLLLRISRITWPGAILGAGLNEWLGDSERGREVGGGSITSLPHRLFPTFQEWKAHAYSDPDA